MAELDRLLTYQLNLDSPAGSTGLTPKFTPELATSGLGRCDGRPEIDPFTVTSGTAFVWRKLPFKTMFFAILLVTNSVRLRPALSALRSWSVPTKSTAR